MATRSALNESATDTQRCRDWRSFTTRLSPKRNPTKKLLSRSASRHCHKILKHNDLTKTPNQGVFTKTQDTFVCTLSTETFLSWFLHMPSPPPNSASQTLVAALHAMRHSVTGKRVFCRQNSVCLAMSRQSQPHTRPKTEHQVVKIARFVFFLPKTFGILLKTHYLCSHLTRLRHCKLTWTCSSVG